MKNFLNALLLASLLLLLAGISLGAEGLRFKVKALDEPVRFTMGTRLLITAEDRGAGVNLADPARAREFTVKTISPAAGDIRLYRPRPSAVPGALELFAEFSVGGLHSVVIDGVVDGLKVHSLELLNVAGPEEPGD